MTTGLHRSIVAAAALALSLTPLCTSAEPQNRLVGTVTDFHGKYGLVVRDQRGMLAEVTLHQGTVIKPEGLRMERGMIVSIVGQVADRTFAAAEIVAPFERWPTSRADAFAGRARNAQADISGLTPNRPAPADGRWTESPDQFSLPQVREPVNPH